MNFLFSPRTNYSGNSASLRDLFLIVVIILATSTSFAQTHDETINGLRYLIDESTKSATLVAKNDEPQTDDDELYTGDIVIPEKVTAKDAKDYLVTTFGDYCFLVVLA